MKVTTGQVVALVVTLVVINSLSIADVVGVLSPTDEKNSLWSFAKRQVRRLDV